MAPGYAKLAALAADPIGKLQFCGGSGPNRLSSGQSYDVRFLADRIMVCSSRSANAMAEIAYPDVEAVEASTTNSGRPTSEFIVLIMACGVVLALLGLFVLGPVGFILGAFIGGLIGAAIGSASAATETTIRIKGGGNELYFVQPGQRADAVKIELSEPLRVIENARSAAAPAPAPTPPAAASAGPAPSERAGTASQSVPDQLTKLASLLQQDLITREEFEQLKADVIAGA